jgi:hypothetical protein
MTSGADGGIHDHAGGHRSQQVDDIVDHHRSVLELTHA